MNIHALVNYDDYRRAAKTRLPRILFDYIDGGSYSETTKRANESAFGDVFLEQRVMIDVDDVSSRVMLFDQEFAAPIICAPVGFAGMYSRRGEVSAARAASSQELPFTLSTVGICSMEEVFEQTGFAPWFQLYMIRDRDAMAGLLQRAARIGSKVLLLTADLQTPATRYRDIRSGMMRSLSLAEKLQRTADGIRCLDWTINVFLRGRPHTFGNLNGVLPASASFADAWQWIGENFDPTVTWDDLRFIRDHWTGPIVLKGIMTTDDAKLARDHGVNGLVVSNHGGRQLDGARASLAALPEIADAVGNDLTVLFDGGVRSGLDVLKAISLGAHACMVGRPWAYALAAGGEAGVAQLLSGLKDELRTAQVLCARTRL